MTRYWGFWTRGKLDILRRYLDAFTTASSGQGERIYLDLFGGQPSNKQKWTDEDLDGSARIALGTQNPPFTRLRFFELGKFAARLDTALKPEFPGRDFKVVEGDCNLTVPGVLNELRAWNWAPTFAFIDPNGAHIHWSTIEALSKFKKPSLSKTEMWILFAAGLFTRNLHTDGSVRGEDADELTAMFGTEQWRAIFEARVNGTLSPTTAREEYVNLMRYRLEEVLMYKWTHPMEVVTDRGTPLYHMIFATDHNAGNRIMTHLYSSAAKEFPAMAAAARQLRPGFQPPPGIQQSLWDDDPATTGKGPMYTYVQPWLPFGTIDD